MEVLIQSNGKDGTWIGVSGLREALATCSDYIRSCKIPCESWSGGIIRKNEIEVGTVTHDGRIFDPNGHQIILR